MFLRPLPLSVIGDRAHGELSINGVKIGEKGHATRNALDQPVDIASQRGITMTCKDVIEAGKYSDHKMYRKLPVKTSVGKLKILPLNGGKFYSKNFAGAGVEFPLPTDENTNQVILEYPGQVGRWLQLLLQHSTTTSRREGESQREGNPVLSRPTMR